MHTDLDFIIDHVFLPPRLPQNDDSGSTKSESLITEVLAAIRSFQAHLPEQERSEWISSIKMVATMLELRGHLGGLVATEVQTTLKRMMDGGRKKPSLGDEACSKYRSR